MSNDGVVTIAGKVCEAMSSGSQGVVAAERSRLVKTREVGGMSEGVSSCTDLASWPTLA